MMNNPYEPVKAFALFLLADSEIEDVEIDKSNSITLYFSKDYKLLIPGETLIGEESWVIDADNDSRFPDFRISCSPNKQLSLSESMKKLPI